MLSSHRHQRILEHLDLHGEVEVASIATELGCSEKTVRRDLEVLENEQRLRRVHGGAVALDYNGIVPIARRMGDERAAKHTIARLAAGQIEEGALIFLGAGSTTLAVASQIAKGPPVTIVTNMVDVAQAFQNEGPHRVFLTGGEYSTATNTLRGAETLEFLDARYFDWVIVGATGVDTELGIVGPTDWHVALTRRLVKRGRRLMVVATESKLGRSDRYRLCSFEETDVVVTEKPPNTDFLSAAADAGVMAVFPSQKET